MEVFGKKLFKKTLTPVSVFEKRGVYTDEKPGKDRG